MNVLAGPAAAVAAAAGSDERESVDSAVDPFADLGLDGLGSGGGGSPGPGARTSGGGPRQQADAASSGTGACRLVDGLLRVERLTVGDPDVVAGARRAFEASGPSGLDTWVTGVLAVGARSVSLAGATAGTDELARSLAALSERTAERAREGADLVAVAVRRATDPASGAVAVSVRSALDGLVGRVDRMLVGEDAPLRTAVAREVRAATDDAAGRVERALAANGQQVRDALARALGDPDGPLARGQRDAAAQLRADRVEVAARLDRLGELLAASGAAKTVMARTAVKGATFEQAAVGALVDAAAPGDLVEATGTASGANGGRQGDAVVTVAPAASRGLAGVRVAVECKDAQVSPAGLARALDEAASNRGSQAALAVVREQRMPGSAGVLVLGPGRLAVGWEPGGDDSLLRAALAMVRAAAIEQAVADALPQVDRAVLVDALRRAAAGLDEWSRIDRALAAARRGLDDLEATAGRVRDRVAAALAAGSRALDAAP